MRSGRAVRPPAGSDVPKNMWTWQAKKISGKWLRAAAVLLVLTTVTLALLQYGGADTFLTDAWIEVPSMPEWQHTPDVMSALMPGYAFAQAMNVLILTATDSITDNNSRVLDDAIAIVTFESGTSRYAAIVAHRDDGVQILDITNPDSITTAGSIHDNGSRVLNDAHDIAIFESGTSRYAAVAALADDGVQILNITNPSSITAAGSITDSGNLELNGPRGIAVFESGTSIYAAVASSFDSGVQILNITNPSSITAAGRIGDNGSRELAGAYDIAIFESGTSRYAAVAALTDDGVQILDITNPFSITTAGHIGDFGSRELNAAHSIAIFESGTSRYAAVTALHDDGVQILDITNPDSITAAGSIGNNGSRELNGPRGITVFEFDTGIYAAVAAFDDDGVQILNITNPDSITAAGSIGDNGSRELERAYDITTFKSNSTTYAAVAAFGDDGVQIIKIAPAPPNTSPTVDAGPDLTIHEGGTFTLSGATATDDYSTTLAYSWSVPDGSGVTFADPAVLSPTITAPSVTSDTEVTLTLTVDDLSGTDVATAADTVALTIKETSNHFVTTWQTTGPDKTITVPGTGTYAVVWGDGSATTTTGAATHEYAAAGTYTVSISGDLMQINLGSNAATNAAKLQSIEQWGNIEWGSMTDAFKGASSMVHNAADVPDLSGVTDVSGMFDGASAFNSDISSWNTSSVTDMSGMFSLASTFNGNISGWDVSGVTNMNNMFLAASTFNQNLSSWNTSSVTDMSGMFFSASAFNSDISEWGVSGVTNMAGMFNNAADFEQNLGKWYIMLDGTSITRPDVPGTVGTISAQNSALAGHNATYGIGTGGDSTRFAIHDGDKLNMTAVVAKSAYKVNVTATGNMVFENDNNWSILEITVTGEDVEDTTSFITTWQTTGANQNVTFPGTGTYTVDWGDGSTPTSEIGTAMHEYAAAGNHTVSISGDLERINLGIGASDNDNDERLLSIEQWGDAEWATMNEAFRGASNMVYNAADAPDLSKVTDMNGMFRDASAFNGTISGWNVSSVTDMEDMFRDASAFNQPLVSWNVSSVTDMKDMFRGASAFNQTLVSWNVSSVTDMEDMFRDASAFNQTLVSWNVSSVTHMKDMFRDASAFNQPLVSWNVSSVTDMEDMFRGASAFNQPLVSWNVSSVTDMSGMFRDASAFNGTISAWNVSSVTDMSSMFRSAESFDQPIGSWSVSSVTEMDHMFNGASAFNQDISDWDVSGVTNMNGMFFAATAFDQNLGKWYVVANSTLIASIPGIVGEISAQNGVLDGHSPAYDKGDGADSDHFEIVSGNLINMTSADTGQASYALNVTASGSNVFENGNNWNLITITVTGDTNIRPTVDAGPALTIHEGGTFTLTGATATDDDTGDTLTYAWSAPATSGVTFADSAVFSPAITAPPVTSDTDVTLTLTVDDQSGTSTATATDTVVLTVKKTSNHFVTTWETDTDDESITIPGTGTYAVIWGDGTADATATNSKEHEYAAAGTYTVSISGDLERINLGIGASDNDNDERLLSIEQWGDAEWATMNEAFRGASNMVYNAADAPDLSRVTDMNGMFRDASAFNGTISGWNVSSVTDMEDMFRDASAFNQPLVSWNVSSVTDMKDMFRGASAFNQTLVSWNVSSVTDMEDMFRDASAFNQPLVSWNVSSVTDMKDMFRDASAFNQTLVSWNVSSVTDMEDMFRDASAFNQPLVSWNVSSVTDMSGMFRDASAFNGTISAWNVSSVTDMSSMFRSAESFDQPIGSWSVSSVTEMDHMFNGTSAFNQDISDWDVSGVTNMNGMFFAATAFDQNLGKWYVVANSTTYDTSAASLNVTAISAQNSALDGHDPVYGIDSGGSHDSELFSMINNSTLAFKAAPSAGTYTANVTASGGDVFENGNNWDLITITVTGNTNTRPTADAGPALTIHEGGTFTLSGATAADDDGDDLTYVWSAPAASGVTIADSTTLSPVVTAPSVTSDTDVTLTLTVNDGTTPTTDTVVLTVKETSNHFVTTWQTGADGESITIPGTGTYAVIWGDGTADATATNSKEHEYATAGTYTVSISGSLERINLNSDDSDAENDDRLRSIEQWGDIGWTSMSNAFNGATNMVYNASDAPDLSRVTDMSFMFSKTESFDGDLSSWDTSNVVDMSNMFDGAIAFNGDISSWNTAGVTHMVSMFSDATAFNGDISSWNTTGVTHMASIFRNAIAFDQDIPDWDISGVTNMANMFYGATKFDGDISGWDTSGVMDMTRLFRNAIAFNQDISGWNVSRVDNMLETFRGAIAFNQNISGWDTSAVTDMYRLFRDASVFNQDISGWNVTQVGMNSGRMTEMFRDADDFDQNLGKWYVVANSTSIAGSDVPGIVGEISAQNTALRGHTPTYGIGNSDDSDHFEIVPGNRINMTSADTGQTSYALNVTASGGDVFENGNNWDLITITVTGDTNTRPTVDAGPALTIHEGGTFTLSGATATDDDGDTLTYAWSATTGSGVTFADSTVFSPVITAPSVTSDTDVTLTLTVDDQSGTSTATATDTVVLTVKETSNHFVTTWQTGADAKSITIPGTGTYAVIWGDGTADATATNSKEHTYATTGTYTVSISGGLEQIRLVDDPENAAKLQSIEQWGDIEWSSMLSAFWTASNMVYNADDAPDLSGVTNTANMFSGATAFNGNLSGWDVSTVTDMISMFRGATSFNGDISGWNTTSVTTMGSMFNDATDFNSNLSGWDVSGVDSMTNMFRGATDFNQDLSSWDVTGTTNMNQMFFDATAFNGNISGWDVSGVFFMDGMFRGATAFDGNLSSWDVSGATRMDDMFRGATAFDSDLSNWDTSSAARMENMFSGASAFNQNISGWDVSKVANMVGMFDGATSFQQNLGKWYVVPDSTTYDTSAASLNVTAISAQNSALDGHDPVYGIDSGGSHDSELFSIINNSTLAFKAAPSVGTYTANVTASGSSVFENGNNWDLITITVTGDTNTRPTVDAGPALTIHEGGTFTLSGATATDDDGDTLTYVWSATTGSGVTFADSTVFSPVITAPSVTSDTDVTLTLTVDDQSGTSTATATDTVVLTVKETSNHFVTTWETGANSESITIPGTGTYAVIWGDGTADATATNSKEHTYATAGTYTVSISGGLERFTLSSSDSDAANDARLLSIEQWGDITWTTMSWAFWDASNMMYNANDAPDLSGVTGMTGMFFGATAFDGDLSSWDVSGVTSMDNMFRGATSFNGDLSGWNVSSVTNMNGMFAGATAFNGNVSGWDTSGVTSMAGMFADITDFNGNVSGWDVSGVTNMNGMFWGASAFNQDLSGWDTSKVTNISGMFFDASKFNQDLSSWNTSGVTSMASMFTGATAFNGNVSGWDVSGVTLMNGMFFNATAFNGNVSGWDVSSATNMTGMFDGATSFQQNLGKWYVVANSTSIAGSDVPGIVGEISAQNTALRGHSPTYGKGDSDDSDHFEIVPGNRINMTSADTGQTSYALNVTASGGDVFENGNNWDLITITVTGDTNTRPTVDAGPALTIHEGGTFTLSGATATDNDGDDLTYAWSAPAASGVTIADSTTLSPVVTAPSVTSDTDATLTLTVSDGTDPTTDTVVLTVKETSSHFVTTWRTSQSNESITIPGTGTYAVIWGDGTADATATNSKEHTYASADTYTVSISGGLTQINLGSDAANAAKLQSIEQWGDIGWTVMASAFRDATNMVYNAGDAPDLSSVTILFSMFYNANSFNGDLSSWDVSGVTSMNAVFFGAASFDGDITGWDVSKVTDMSTMFNAANAFDKDISGWDTSKVTDMSSMFSFATAFNQDISDWDVSGVTNMNGMFFAATAFDQNLGKWYVVPGSTTYDTSAASLNVTAISAQNSALDGHDPVYGIDSGGSHDSELFSMINNSTLAFKAAPSAGTYTANVTASGGDVFENGNNWDLITITVTDDDEDAEDTTSFITTWRTASANRTVTIPGTGTYTVDWGDGGTPTSESGTATHEYTDADTYTVSISGGLTRIHLGDTASNNGNDAKLRSIEQWGNMEWSSMNGAFWGASNMVYNAGDAPDLSGVTDMNSMFRGATAFDGDISGWDVSNVTNMIRMFLGASTFNQDLTSWDTRSVTDMTDMFFGATDFDGDITGWNVSGVTDMAGMFNGASDFNGDISGWNVSGATNMGAMFNGATAFNKDLTSWDTRSVTFMDGMFRGATDFDGDISGWDVSGATRMDDMFRGATDFDGDLSSWDVSGATNMGAMFRDATAFNGDISGWNVSKVDNMVGMFRDATAFNGDISGWNVSKVDNMFGMFNGATSFQQNLGKWYVVPDDTSIARLAVPGIVGGISAQNGQLDFHSPTYGIGKSDDSDHFMISGNLINMISTDTNQTSYKLNVTASGSSVFENGNNWDLITISVDNDTTSFVTTWQTASANRTVTIPGTGTYTVDWGDRTTDTDVSDTQTHTYAAAGTHTVIISGGLTRIHLGDTASNNGNDAKLRSIEQWGNMEWSSMNGAFWGASNMVYNAGDAPDLSGVTDMNSMFRGATAFDGDISGWDVSNVTNMIRMFLGASTFNQDLTSWDTRSVTDMTDMFFGATDFDGDITGWNVSGVTDMAGMFNGASDFNGDISGWNVSGATNMGAMFNGATAFNKDLTSWDTRSVTFMDGMFRGATDFDGDISGWDVSGATRMDDMFRGATDFDGDLSSWDVSGATNMGAMFRDATAFNGDISGWNVSKVDNMVGMFRDATAFNGDISGWNVSKVDNMFGMFNGATSFQQNLGKWYVVANSTSILRSDVPGIVGGISAQNGQLDFHSPTYGIGNNDDSDHFVISGNLINMTSSDTGQSSYDLNVTASGDNVFENGNNWSLLVIEVTGQTPDTTPPVITIRGSNPATVTVNTTYSDAGATCEDAVDGTRTVTTNNQVNTDTVGTYSVVYSCSDTSNNEATATRTVIVQAAVDNTSPVITIRGSNPAIVTVNTTYSDAGATCVDAVDGTRTVTTDNQVNTDTVGTYSVVYSCSDTSNNEATATRTVIVQTAVDNTSPVITIRGSNPAIVTVNTTYSDAGATCVDAVDGTRTVTTDNQVNTDTVGTYSVVYSCSDTSNNEATATRTVIVQTAVDNTSPVITIRGSNPATVTVNTTYSDAGATCEDAVDGTRTVTTNNQVNTDTVGTYSVVYSCSDTSNNEATATRTVIVQAAVDNTSPVITIRGSNPATVTVNTTYSDAGATCVDAVDGTRTVTTDNQVNTGTVGTYSVVYSCSDTSNNEATATRTVTVQQGADTTPPAIIIHGSNPARVLVGTVYVDAGATCRDNFDGDFEPTLTTNTVDADNVGSYTVTYTCIDAKSNESERTRTVRVLEEGDFTISKSSKSAPLTVGSDIMIDGKNHDIGGSGAVVIKQNEVMPGEPVEITFTVHSADDIIHLTVYLNLHGGDTRYAYSDTYIRYDHSTVQIHDPHSFISDASITITDDTEQPDKKIIDVIIVFDGDMGLTNMVLYMWNEDRNSQLIRIIDAIEVVTAPQEPEVQAADPEPVEPDSVLPVDPEPMPADTVWPGDYDEAQVLSLIRMWSGFESETITDEQLLASLGLDDDDYPDADIPDWVMTDLGVLVAKGDVTVGEFMLALQYVLEYT